MIYKFLSKLSLILLSFASSTKKLETIKKIAELKFPIFRMDDDQKAVLVDVGDPLVVGVYLDDDEENVRIEATIVFEARVANLRTLSNIAHCCLTHGLMMSGLVPAPSHNLKVYIAKDIPFSKIGSDLHSNLSNVKVCLEQVVDYIQQRTEQFKMSNIDLSMFEDIDVLSFNPRNLGERKDFVYQSWGEYAKVLDSDNSDDLLDSINTVEELRACAEFEHKNNMLLSEVGDIVLNELMWNRQITEAVQEGDFYVH